MKGIEASVGLATPGLKAPQRRFGAVTSALLALVLLLPPLMMMVAVPRTAFAAVGTTFQVTDTTDKHQSPRIGGKIVVWEDDANGESNIRYKDLATGESETFVVAAGVRVKRKPVTNGSFIFWEDDRSGDSDIYGFEISSGTEFVLAGGAGDQRKPEIEGKTVVWQSKSADSGWKVHSVDLTSYDPASGTSPARKLEATGGDTKMNPVISDRFIVWEETRNGNSGIYAKDRQTGKEIKITSGFSVGAPAVSGNVAVWQQTDGGTFDIFGKDLETGKMFTVVSGSGDQVAPAISGKLVVWQDGPNDKADIRGKDLETGEEFLIAGGDGKPHNFPAISGDTVVWQDESLSENPDGSTELRLDILGANLDVAPAAPKGLKATGSPDGIALKWNANTEADLAGYNVYRSDSADGAYTKLNDTLLTTPAYDDAQAPKGAKSYYQVTAVDDTQKESVRASASSAAHVGSDLGLTAGSGTIKAGETLSFSGKLSSAGKDLSGKDVTLLQRPAGSRGYKPTDNQPAPTGADGGFSVQGIKPSKTTFYRARFSGETENGVQSSISGPERVNVKLPASLDLRTGRARLVVGQRTDLSGKLSSGGKGISGERVLLVKRAAGDKRFSRVPDQPRAGVLTGSDGSYRLGGINPRKNTVYRAIFRGGPELQREVSAPRRVNVKARVSANVGSSNSRVSIGGRVITARTGSVRVIVKRNGTIIKTSKVKLVNSRYQAAYKLPKRGKYTVNASFARDFDNLGNVSPIKRFSVGG